MKSKVLTAEGTSFRIRGPESYASIDFETDSPYINLKNSQVTMTNLVMIAGNTNLDIYSYDIGSFIYTCADSYSSVTISNCQFTAQESFLMTSHTNAGLIISGSTLNLLNLKGILNIAMKRDNSTQTDVCGGNAGTLELRNNQILLSNKLLDNVIEFPGFGNITIENIEGKNN